MGKKIDASKFKDIKYAIAHAPTNKVAAANQNVSLETIRKVKNSKTYAEFEKLNEIKREAQSTTLKAATAPQEDKRGFWGRLFNI